jgi:hypothetical protein
MIGFEEQTKPLTDWERNHLLPIMVHGLKTKVGQEKAITSSEIINALRRDPYNYKGKVNGARVRKVINHIRIKGLVQNLVATSKGYYIEMDRAAIENYKQSLRDRIASIQAVLNSFEP